MHRRIPTDRICTYCPMNKQYVKGVPEREKSCLIIIIAGGEAIFIVQRAEAKRKKGFLRLSFDNS